MEYCLDLSICISRANQLKLSGIKDIYRITASQQWCLFPWESFKGILSHLPPVQTYPTSSHWRPGGTWQAIAGGEGRGRWDWKGGAVHRRNTLSPTTPRNSKLQPGPLHCNLTLLKQHPFDFQEAEEEKHHTSWDGQQTDQKRIAWPAIAL